MFDEERFVEAGRSVQAFDTRWGRAAILICEDAWHSFTPMLAALGGAQLIIIPSASPARGVITTDDTAGRPTSLARWRRIVQDIAGEHGVFVALSQLVGFEGGKAFPGGSILRQSTGRYPRGRPDLRGGADPGDPRLRGDHPRPRRPAAARRPGDAAAPPPWLAPRRPPRRPVPTATAGRGRHQPRERRRLARSIPTAIRTLARITGDPLAIDADLTRRWLVEFIRDEVRRRRGFEQVVIGLSGGVDSSLVAFLAAEALGPEHVLGIRMPYRTSSPESLSHAQLVSDALGIRTTTVDISAAVDGLAGAIGGAPEPGRLGNIMARTRMITLFDLSAANRALPLGTGNKTERLFGYFTWHADDSPPVNPIGDLFKTQVWALARHLGVPDVIVSKPASADLIVGQTDESDFGISYPRADAILHWILLGYRDGEIAALGFTEAETALVRKRLDSTHWKRRLPTVAMLSGTAIGEYYLRPVDY